jgi:hypothetical protein
VFFRRCWVFAERPFRSSVARFNRASHPRQQFLARSLINCIYPLLTLTLVMSSPAANGAKVEHADLGTAFELGDYRWKEMHADMENDHFAGTYGGQSTRRSCDMSSSACVGGVVVDVNRSSSRSDPTCDWLMSQSVSVVTVRGLTIVINR